MATAGHVDHGKTSLVRLLTGVDTDRLEEEKRRGLSINLGFAYRKLAGHRPIGFIDVPGHHRFINTMIAGVSGIDLGMLVVAADDGPMPQTREHLDILHLLGVKRLLLVVTKTDRVSAQRVQEVTAQVLARLSVIAGEAVPAFPVCNTSGEGVAALVSCLEQRARETPERSTAGGFRLSVDRAFNLKGVGLVVTGTATAGAASVGDTLVLQPAGVQVRVRGIHVQDEQAATARAGQRCALNIVGSVDKETVGRGDWLLDPGAGPMTQCMGVRVRLLDAAPFALKHLCPVKLYLGARRVAGRLFLLEGGKRLAPGESALAQLVLDDAVSSCHGERLLLRDDSESFTLGSAVVLDPYAPTRGKKDRRRLHALRALETDSPRRALQALVVEQALLVDVEQFRRAWNLREEDLPSLSGNKALHRINTGKSSLLVCAARWQRELARVTAYFDRWHRNNPHDVGVNSKTLPAALQLEQDLLEALLQELLQASVLVSEDGKLRLRSHQVSLSGEDAQRLRDFEAFLQARGREIPLLSQVSTETGLRRKTLLRLGQVAVREGRLHRISENRYATVAQLAELAQLVLAIDEDNQPLTVVNFKNRMGTGRKVAIAVLEYFDSIRFTCRRGDTREILDREVPARLFRR